MSQSPELPDLERGYFKRKLDIIIRDLSSYTAPEMARELARLAWVADEIEFAKEARRAQPEGEAPQAVGRALRRPSDNMQYIDWFTAVHNLPDGAYLYAGTAPAAQHAESGAQAAEISGLPRYKLMSGDQREWLAPAADGPWCKFDHAAALLAAQSQGAQANEFEVAIHDCALILDLPKGAGAMDVCRAVNRLATAAQQAAAPGALDADEMTRLRRLMRAIGWDHERDESDRIVRGTLFAVLGRAADKLEQAAPSAPGTPEAPQTAAARDVLAERQRQVEVEGWTPARDDQYENDELSQAAACYAMSFASESNYAKPMQFWPWDMAWWKPQGTRRNLVKAGALILADIERLDRAAQLDGGQGEGK